MKHQNDTSINVQPLSDKVATIPYLVGNTVTLMEQKDLQDETKAYCLSCHCVKEHYPNMARKHKHDN